MAKNEGEILSALGLGRSKDSLSPLKTNVSIVLAKWADGIIKALQKNLDEKNKNASSNLRQSINFKIKYFGFNLNFALALADYYEWVDKGRGASTGGASSIPLKDKIFKWITMKPAVQSMVGWSGMKQYQKEGLAFAIARKIHKKGYKGSNFYTDVVNPTAFNNLRKDLRIAIGKDISINVTVLKEEVKNKFKWQ